MVVVGFGSLLWLQVVLVFVVVVVGNQGDALVGDGFFDVFGNSGFA